MKPFHFKQFKIYHEQSFKVGTDGVLLGTWVNISGRQSVLDIGTGSGLIPLVIAQRTDKTTVIGVEIDELSFIEATKNVQASPWANRVSIINETIQLFAEKEEPKFDLVVSNPPYFINSLKSTNKKKNTARHTDSLSFEELLDATLKLLTTDGKLALVLPKTAGGLFITLAKQKGLYLTRLTEVRSKKDKPVERFLMEFSLKEKVLEQDELVIQFEKRNDYTPAYTALTKDFYTIFS